jgi:hypothetical protein
MAKLLQTNDLCLTIKAPAVAEALVDLHKLIVAGRGYLIGQRLYGLLCGSWRVFGLDSNVCGRDRGFEWSA